VTIHEFIMAMGKGQPNNTVSPITLDIVPRRLTSGGGIGKLRQDGHTSITGTAFATVEFDEALNITNISFANDALVGQYRRALAVLKDSPDVKVF
jgi:hypothetical protein